MVVPVVSKIVKPKGHQVANFEKTVAQVSKFDYYSDINPTQDGFSRPLEEIIRHVIGLKQPTTQF